MLSKTWHDRSGEDRGVGGKKENGDRKLKPHETCVWREWWLEEEVGSKGTFCQFILRWETSAPVNIKASSKEAEAIRVKNLSGTAKRSEA